MKKACLALLLVFIVFVVVSCQTPIQSETINSVEDTEVADVDPPEYEGYTAVAPPAVSELLSGNYYVEYYNRLDPDTRKLYRITGILEEIKSVDITYRVRPIYTLSEVITNYSFSIAGNVIEASNSELFKILKDTVREQALGIYYFYVKDLGN